MPVMNPIGHFRGLSLIQTNGKVGGYRNVFVNLVGNHNDLPSVFFKSDRLQMCAGVCMHTDAARPDKL